MSQWIPDTIAGASLAVAAWAVYSSHRTGRAATAGATRATDLAAEANASADSMAESLRRIADSQEAAAEWQRERGQQTPRAERWTEAGGSAADEVTVTADASGRVSVAVDFAIEYRRGSEYAIRNVSTTDTATNVRIDPADFKIARDLPAGLTLAPLQSSPFLVISAMGAPIPGEAIVSCDQWPEPRRVPMPPRR